MLRLASARAETWRPAASGGQACRLLASKTAVDLVKEGAAAVTAKLSDAVQGAAGESAAREEVPHSEQGERLFAGGAEIPALMPEESFAGGLERLDAQGQEVSIDPSQTFKDADPEQAAHVPQIPYGLEETFEDNSFKHV